MIPLLRSLLPAFFAWSLLSGSVEAMLFRSERFSAHWDTWAIHHEGVYYTYYLVTEHGYGEGIGLATSNDGVHWQDHGLVIEQSDRNTYYLGSGSVWKATDFDRSGRFICNYSEHRQDPEGRQTQNILFAWSTDLIHWNKYGDEQIFKANARYYDPLGRWDAIYAFPRPAGGYYGAWSASGPRPERRKTIGIGFTEDGLNWQALPPPQVDMPSKEVGAIYPIAGRLHALMVLNDGMWSATADHIEGPYVRAPKNAHLLRRGPGAFTRYLPTTDGLLVNHYHWSGHKAPRTPRSVGRDREITFFSPFKRVTLDDEGIQRWKYWEGNEALKGKPIAVTEPGALPNVDQRIGVVLEAIVQSPTDGTSPPELRFDLAGKTCSLRLLPGGVVEMRDPTQRSNNWRGLHRVDRERPIRETVRLRVLLRAGMMEVYVDDHFIECWTIMQAHQAPAVSIYPADRSTDSISGLSAWQMSLPSVPPITTSDAE